MSLISVVERLVWPAHWYVDVGCLIFGESRQLGSKLRQVQGCNLLVQVLREDIHLLGVLSRAALIPKLQLSNHLEQDI